MIDTAHELVSPALETWKFAPGLHTSSVVAAIRLSTDGRISYANRAMLSLLKVDSLDTLQRDRFQRKFLRDAGEWRMWSAVKELGVRRGFEARLIDTDGGEAFISGDIWFEDGGGGAADHISGIFTDVTVLHQLHRGLQRTARFEAIGGLTSGIIHDVNNVLTVLQGNLYLAGDSIRDIPSAYEKLKRARDAARRGGELTKQLLSFARGEEVGSSTVDPNKLISNLAPLLGRALGQEVTLKTAVDRRVSLIHANEAQLQSALVNLAVNSRDAMSGEGTIVIRASNAKVSEEKSGVLGIAAGSYVQISVIDNGPGIPENVKDKVFDPFFSTKGPDRGTGLGLSMVRWLCEQTGGAVTLSSRIGKGTIVTLILPCSAQQSTDTTQKTMPLSMLPTGEENLVLLSSDEQMCWMVTQVLETLGYSVRVAPNSVSLEEAMTLKPSQLVIADTTEIGEDNIPAFVTDLQGRYPSLRLLVIHDEESVTGHPEICVLFRPFSPFDLAVIVRRTLDGAQDD